MTTKLTAEAKNKRNIFLGLNNAVFGKTMENVIKRRISKLVTVNKRRSYLVSEPDYHTKKWFSENLLVIEVNKIKATMNKPVDLSLSLSEISKTLMYVFWCDYIKRKYQYNSKLCYMDTDNFIIQIETKDIHEDITNDVENGFDASNYEINRPLPTEKKNWDNEIWSRRKVYDRIYRT